MHARFVPLLSGGEVQEVGHALWTMSATPLIFANGVIRYDARDFGGQASERELDNCLTALSMYDVPWRFSAWDHLGADVLVPRLIARGMIRAGTDHAMWLDLSGAWSSVTSEDRIDIKPATDASDHRTWTRIFTTTTGIPNEYADMILHMVARPPRQNLVAWANGRAVGCLTVTIEEGLAIVHNVGVLLPARHRGVGRRLLLAAHEAAFMQGARACVTLATPEGAVVCARLGHHVVTSVTYLMPPPAGGLKNASLTDSQEQRGSSVTD